MRNALRRLAALIMTCVLLTGTALADIAWPQQMNPAQTMLMAYVTRINEGLAAAGQPQINALFELYPAFAVLGISSDPSTMIPEGVEMTFTMHQDTLNTLDLRVSDPELFPTLAGLCISSVDASISQDEARKYAEGYARRAIASPLSSFEEEPDLTNSTTVKAYFAYYPNQFGDGNSWLQMTLIFARPGSVDGSISAVGATPPPATSTEEYEGYFSQDNYSHFEVFASPTPEPDSAAMEP